MRNCIGTVSLGGSVIEKIEAIAGAGFHSIELFDEDLLGSGLSAREVAQRCQDVGLSIESYQPFRRAEGVPEAEFADVVSRFREALRIATDLGTESIVIVSNTDRDAVADRDHSAAQVAALATLAAEHGKSVMFEALSWGTHVRRLADAWDVLQRAGLAKGCLVVDTFHLFALGDGVTDLAALPDDAVGLVQLADAPRLQLDVMQWSRNHRCFPGDGDFDVPGAFAAMLARGFAGTVSLEIFNPGYRQQPPREVAFRGAISLRFLRAHLEQTTYSRR